MSYKRSFQNILSYYFNSPAFSRGFLHIFRRRYTKQSNIFKYCKIIDTLIRKFVIFWFGRKKEEFASVIFRWIRNFQSFSDPSVIFRHIPIHPLFSDGSVNPQNQRKLPSNEQLWFYSIKDQKATTCLEIRNKNNDASNYFSHESSVTSGWVAHDWILILL